MDESKLISLTINGRAVEAKPNETLLAVTRRYGVEIPTLCDHKAVLPYGVCRLCVVDINKGDWAKMVIACIYQPGEGDVVETNSARVRQTRRVVLELLLARCPHVAQIQGLAREYGATAVRFQVPTDNATSERCILCGLCVRVCRDVIGQSAIGYCNRGGQRMITSPLGVESEKCIGCRACVHVCPTGALHFEDHDGERVMQELHTHLPMANCRVCGTSFVTQKQLAGLKGRTAVLIEMLETCPDCRRKQASRSLGKIQVSR